MTIVGLFAFRPKPGVDESMASLRPGKCSDLVFKVSHMIKARFIQAQSGMSPGGETLSSFLHDFNIFQFSEILFFSFLFPQIAGIIILPKAFFPGEAVAGQ